VSETTSDLERLRRRRKEQRENHETHQLHERPIRLALVVIRAPLIQLHGRNSEENIVFVRDLEEL
jgi:hypothetical protein